MTRTRSRLIITALLAALSVAVAGAQKFEFFQGATHDPKVPTPESILGYPIGSYHTDYAGLERWLAVLRTSDRVKIVRYGTSVERRPMYLIFISSPANIAKIDQIQAAMRKLADPRTTSDAEAETIAKSLPAVAWVNHGVDGNESAALESAIQTSYQLTAGTDETTRLILERLVTIVNPAHTADAHERFVAWYNTVQVGPQGTSDPAAAEHNAPWGMNTNNGHYQIDPNRDAFFLTQQESRYVAKAIGEWNPVLFVDHHGQPENMFFPPNAEAVNLNVTKNQRDWLDKMGAAISEQFDRRGWSYFRGRRFDLFYPGFWDSWPTLNGAIGMTYETDGGGNKGLAAEKRDGTVVTLRDATARHHTGAMAALKVTADQKDQRLRDFYEYKKQALDEGAKGPMKQVVLFPGRDQARADMLVETLRLQRIEVVRVSRPFKLLKAHSYMGGAVGPRDVPEGAYLISLAQPQGHLARAILEQDPVMPESFLKEQERLKERADLYGERVRDGFYDMTGWALPLLYAVDAVWAEDAVPIGATSAATGGVPVVGAAPAPAEESGSLAAEGHGTEVAVQAAPSGAPARYGYAFSSDSTSSMRLTAQLLKEGFNLAVATEAFSAAGQDFPRGSIIARSERNPAALHDRIRALSADTGMAVVALSSGGATKGADFGDESVMELRIPRVAVVTDDPTADRGYANVWFTLEKRFGLPFTAIKIEQLLTAPLSRYNVIVLPSGTPAAYQEALGENGVARLRRWVQEGGTLVLIEGAAAFGGRKGVDWTQSTLKRREVKVRLFFDEKQEAAVAPAAPATSDQAAPGARQPAQAAKPGPAQTAADEQARGGQAAAGQEPTREIDLPRTPGAILRVKIDGAHFLGLGYNGDVGAVVASNYAFTISRTGKTVAAFAPEDNLKLSGFMWPEAKKALARTPYAWIEPSGRGQAIFFAADPNYRVTQFSTLRLFFNALVFGPSFTSGR